MITILVIEFNFYNFIKPHHIKPVITTTNNNSIINPIFIDFYLHFILYVFFYLFQKCSPDFF